jgi:NifB/MoaA-like Fe-S oxidoreductase
MLRPTAAGAFLDRMIKLIRPFPAPLDSLYAWQTGDAVTHLDGRPIEDILDLYYYTPESRTTALGIQRETGETLQLEMDPGDIDAVTDCFAPMEFKTCACDCVFCFIDQNPDGMRDQIYVKDEDYRFSFLYGNYITLTSLGKRGLRRIIEQRMSPLYVSVHATDIDVRTRMLGIKRRFDVMEILRELTAAGIEIHTQVVLCPGWNEGAILEKTFRDLLTLGAPHTDDDSPFNAVCERGFGYDGHDLPGAPEAMPLPEDHTGPGGVKSLAIVPVGLSDHREGLTKLEPVSPALADAVIDQVAGWQREARELLGYSFVYLSDEFFLMAERPFPPSAQYDGFWQIDNAIGLTARLRDTWQETLAWAKEEGTLPRQPVTVLTGQLAAKAWRREFAAVIEASGAAPVEVVGVDNRFYGNAVTVAGLLSGSDLRRALKELPTVPARRVILSPRVINSDGLTLDGMTLADLHHGHPHQVMLGEEDGFIDFWRDLG